MADKKGFIIVIHEYNYVKYGYNAHIPFKKLFTKY